MKILWLSHLVPYPPRAGVVQRSYGLLSELCKRHEVTLMAFHQPALMQSMSDDPDAALSEAIEKLESQCARVRIFDIPSEGSSLGRYGLALRSLFTRDPYTINWLKSPAFEQALTEESTRVYDVVHFDTISLAVYRNEFENIPRVMNHHNVESHLLHRRARLARGRLARLYYGQEATRLEAYEQDTAAEFDLHVTCSPLDTERLRQVIGDIPIHVIPNGVDMAYFDGRICERVDPTFAFVGTLGWGPNREAVELICAEIWPALAERWTNARMLLIGSNAPQSAVSLASTDERVRVTGFVNDVRPFLADTCFFLCPIKEGGGTKLKILNAMAMEKVVVADPIACEGIDVSTGQDVLLATTANDYVARVAELLEDPARYHRIARASRQLIQRLYSYEVIGRELDAEYTKLASHAVSKG